jgi:hypothetical protein
MQVSTDPLKTEEALGWLEGDGLGSCDCGKTLLNAGKIGHG